MKKSLLTICVSVISMTTVFAQTSRSSIEATDIKLIRKGEQIEVSFTLRAGKKATKASYSLVVNPIVRGGTTQRQLPPVVIRGKRSKANDDRHELAAGERRYEQIPVYTAPGTSLDYTTILPYEEWMRGGEILFEGVSVGCCSANEVELGLIAQNILYAEPVAETKVSATEVVIPRQSTGDLLAEQYRFVTPIAEFERIESGTDYNMPLAMAGRTPQQDERLIAETREGSISVYFRQGRRTLDRNFSGNNRRLVELISAVRVLSEARDSRIVRIIIAGFASPEGSVTLNDRLAHDRAVAIKEFLTANSEIDPRTVQIFNGGVDWQGLRELIAGSDMYGKRHMLDIIDNTPVRDSYQRAGRLGELMRFDGGDRYRYMFREFFPRLRQAAYIKVYYENN